MTGYNYCVIEGVRIYLLNNRLGYILENKEMLNPRKHRGEGSGVIGIYIMKRRYVSKEVFTCPWDVYIENRSIESPYF